MLLDRRLIILGFAGFVTSFGAHVVAVNLPTYAKGVAAGTLVIGLLIAVYDFAEVIAKPIFGWLADKKGQVLTLWAGLGVFSLASFVFVLVDPRWLIAIRLAQGVGAAAFSVISIALVAAYFPTRRGEAIGTYNALKGAGYVIAPVAGGFIVAASSFAMIFIATGIIGVIVLAASLLLKEPERPAKLDDDDDDFSFKGFLAPFTSRDLAPWYGVIIANMFAIGILFGFVPVQLNALGYTPFQAGLIIGACTLAYLAIQPVSGRLADTIGTRRIILIGLFASTTSILALPFLRGVPLIGVLVLGGLGVGAVWTNTDTMVSQLAKRNQLAASLGTAGSYKEIGDMLGPITIGAVSQVFGLTIGFVASGLLGLAALLIVATLTRASSNSVIQ